MRDAAVAVPEGWENAGMLLVQPLSPWRLSVALMTDEAKAVKPVSVSALKRKRRYASRRNALNFWLADLGSNQGPTE